MCLDGPIMINWWVSFCSLSSMISWCCWADCMFLLAGLRVAPGFAPMRKPLSGCGLQNPCLGGIEGTCTMLLAEVGY